MNDTIFDGLREQMRAEEQDPLRDTDRAAVSPLHDWLDENGKTLLMRKGLGTFNGTLM